MSKEQEDFEKEREDFEEEFEEINRFSFEEMKRFHETALETARIQAISIKIQSEAINNLTKALGILVSPSSATVTA